MKPLWLTKESIERLQRKSHIVLLSQMYKGYKAMDVGRVLRWVKKKRGIILKAKNWERESRCKNKNFFTLWCFSWAWYLINKIEWQVPAPTSLDSRPDITAKEDNKQSVCLQLGERGWYYRVTLQVHLLAPRIFFFFFKFKINWCNIVVVVSVSWIIPTIIY